MRRLVRRIAVGAPLPDAGELSVAAEVFLPDEIHAPATLLFCLPGGGMNRGYYHLVTATGDDTYSFAAFFTGLGYIVASVDPLGVGASSRPADGHALTPDVLVAANAKVLKSLVAELNAGGFDGAVPPGADITVIGVGHSMGAMLTVMQQARFAQFAAIVLLGFSTQGMPAVLSEEENALIGDPVATRARLSELARRRSGDPYPRMPETARGQGMFGGGRAFPDVVQAVRANRVDDVILMAAGLFAMIPGSCAPECARIEVPLFIGVGDSDIGGIAHRIPADFPAASDITLRVLRDTAHNHFLFPSTKLLFRSLDRWLETCARLQNAAERQGRS